MITVIIIDDHPLVLNGFEFILHNLSDIKIMGTFTNAAEAIGYLKENRIDVVLADINMPEMNGIDATLSIKKIQPSAQVIAISNIGEGSIVQRMLDAGAKGYLLKNVSARDLLNSIHSVMSNTSAISPELEDILKKTDSSVPRITQREHEVLRLLTTGKTTLQIAEQMYISPLTVESHRRNLLRKFTVSNSASLIHRATELKFL